MLAFPIYENNLPIITELNGGVTPKIENEPTFFIFDPEAENKIVTKSEFYAEFSHQLFLLHSGCYMVKKI